MVNMLRLAAVGAIVSLVVGGFAWAGGWLAPHAATPARLIDTFEQVNGLHPGFRRNHAKGVGVRGTFRGNGQGQRLSRAKVFAPADTPVLGRFALAGGMPYTVDTLATTRSMALRFSLPDGEEWRTGMNNVPVFPVRTGEDMGALLLATAPDPATGKADPARAGAFFAVHPETSKALALIKSVPPTTGFADSTYNSLNAFFLVNEAGVSTPVRWAMVPDVTGDDAGTVANSRTPTIADAGSAPNAVFDALLARLHAGALSWHLVMTLAAPGDAIEDPTIPWPKDREKVDVGTLTLDRVEAEEDSEARTVNFDPTIVPAGITPSNDPILSARSAAYAQSFRRRLAEPVSSSAVSPAEVAR